MVVICEFYGGHLLPIYLLQAIYSFSRDPHSTPVPMMLLIKKKIRIVSMSKIMMLLTLIVVIFMSLTLKLTPSLT